MEFEPVLQAFSAILQGFIKSSFQQLAYPSAAPPFAIKGIEFRPMTQLTPSQPANQRSKAFGLSSYAELSLLQTLKHRLSGASTMFFSVN
jgi:hypothetical protein